jgi:hypothetical protein
MSGPIVRKYGFPNFGERELKHGAEAEATTPPPASTTDDPPKPTQEAGSAGKDASPPKP